MHKHFKTFLSNLNLTGRKIIATTPQSENEWDSLYVLVSQLENHCRKFRKELTIRRDKDETKLN